MNIEYHKPTIEDKRRRAGFWIGVGQFITSTFFGYIMLVIVIVLTWIIFFGKVFKEVTEMVK